MANRFLHREEFSPQGWFEQVRLRIEPIGGILSVADAISDEPHSLAAGSSRDHQPCFSALRASVHLEFSRVRGEPTNWHELKRRVANQAVAAFIREKTCAQGV